MLKRIRAVREDDSGFTLTELLITIVILGVLAGIVVFAVTGFTNDGRTVACNADRKNVEIATEAYYAKTGAYPVGADSATRIGLLITNSYLKQAPAVNPAYVIELQADGDVVVLVGGLEAACP